MIGIVDEVVVINNVIIAYGNHDASLVICYVISNNVVVSSTIEKDANVAIVGYCVFIDGILMFSRAIP